MAGTSARSRGRIEPLPCGALRVVVYAGVDPISKKRHYLKETVPAGPQAPRTAEKVRTRLLKQVDDRQAPRTSATVNQLLDRYLVRRVVSWLMLGVVGRCGVPNRAAAALGLRAGDREELERLTRSSSVRAGLAARARIVLLAADGESNTWIAELVGVSRPTVIGWRGRYAARGLAGLDDEPRSGRPRRIDLREIVAATLRPPPRRYAVTHWSSRLLGKHLKIGDATVARAWREYGVQPWRAESFRFSTDPQLEAKVVDVVGLYLHPPENAVVLCVDEKSQIQALDRTAPILPLQPGLPERRSHDYVRHGTSTLFAALEIATGQVTAACKPRHRHQEFLAFLKQVTRAYPGGELHLVMDNYAAHKHPNVRAWLAANPRVIVHFTPTHASWMNLVEVWFSILERQAIHRGSFGSVRDLTATIRAFITGWNDPAHPFTWTKTADQILTKANRKKTSDAGH